MKPVKTGVSNVVYRGHGDVGDLWCHRAEPGLIMAVYEPDEQERALLAKDGMLVLWIHTEPIPPVGLEVSVEDYVRPVGSHPFKVIAELDDPERQ